MSFDPQTRFFDSFIGITIPPDVARHLPPSLKGLEGKELCDVIAEARARAKAEKTLDAIERIDREPPELPPSKKIAVIETEDRKTYRIDADILLRDGGSAQSLLADTTLFRGEKVKSLRFEEAPS